MPRLANSQLKTAQIGRCGELLVQYRLLLRGIESAPMTTDAGIDLVAYTPTCAKPVTIQVKTNLKPKPGGGRGRPALDWWIEDDNPAQLVALVDLSESRVWLFTQKEIGRLAQQRPAGRYHLYMYVDPDTRATIAGRLVHAHEFGKYLLENRVMKIFGG